MTIRHNTAEPWARREPPRRPALDRPWRFAVLIGALVVGVSDAGVVLVRIDNVLARQLAAEGTS